MYNIIFAYFGMDIYDFTFMFNGGKNNFHVYVGKLRAGRLGEVEKGKNSL